MRHPRYCLTHHPGISSNITNATHFSTPPKKPTLAHTPHFTHVGTPPTSATLAGNPRQHVTHASMSPTLSSYQRKHTTHASRSPTQVRHLRHPCQHKQHAITQTPEYPISSQIPKGDLAGFTFSFYLHSLYFLGLLKYFHRSLENCYRKTKLFQRKLVCLIQKTTIFSKTNAQVF